jgi:hypothetical protein
VRINSQSAEKGVEFKALDDSAIDTSSRTGKLVVGILALIAAPGRRRPQCSRPGAARADGFFIMIVPKATATNSTVNPRNTSENAITIPS